MVFFNIPYKGLINISLNDKFRNLSPKLNVRKINSLNKATVVFLSIII